MMNFTDEMIAKAKTAASAEELQNFAKEEGIELTSEEAEMYFSFLTNKSGPLSDDELEQVAGGKGGQSTPDPKYRVGQKVEMDWPGVILKGSITGTEYYNNSYYGWLYIIHFDQETNIRKQTKEISLDYREYLEFPKETIRIY